ncbi:stage V sporulation protein AC [Desulforamulus aeronauticus]|uniref:Stage V sporulation protein AC n=1 Tax=Desulforamulus aeronauticus DSM 10349 TaxID=1121421 RepID=A0A1M6PCQ5_9FIRM|nr:stage V sporulation protein AC [Desulforamulus aeronauticus]SHK05642.1 stage V sporulation protein AC [Desulforamulus aeronauticus DSM 10349]
MVTKTRANSLEVDKANYETLVQQVKPKPKVLRNSVLAFLMGGAICALGQICISFFKAQGLATQDAVLATSMVLVFLAALLTGLGIYNEMAKYAGAGMIVPITGFANSMVAPAMEFRSEGMVFGVGARLFMIAGPVLVFGIVAAWLAGLITYLCTLG